MIDPNVTANPLSECCRLRPIVIGDLQVMLAGDLAAVSYPLVDTMVLELALQLSASRRSQVSLAWLWEAGEYL